MLIGNWILMKGVFILIRIVIYTFVFVFLYSFSNTITAQAEALQGVPQRIDGKDRFEVAENVSKYWDQAEYAVVVNYLAYADALTSAPLAFKYKAPIFLTHPDYLTSSTKEELDRLNVKKVFIIGGAGSISDEVIRELE